MAATQDLVLTFCPKMRCVPQKKLKLLMPVFLGTSASEVIYQTRGSVSLDIQTVRSG